MTLKTRVQLPFVDDFPVHVQIRIQAQDREYEAYVQADWSKWHRFHVGVKQHDIEEFHSELQQAIEEVSQCLENNVDSSEYARALSNLAYKGNFIFKRIFSGGVPREIISKALRTGATVQISSEEFFIPWELLYDGPLDPVDISYFWGMRYIISRALIQDARPGDFVHPIIDAFRPRVGLIAYDQLTYVVKEEIPLLKELSRKKRIYLSILRPLDASRRNTELNTFGRFLAKKLQIIHLACHAYIEKPISQSYLLISDDFPVTIEDFCVQEFNIKHNPFVILNACLTGIMNPLYTSNWASVFWENGARGVLATEFHVPDWFAAVFVKELYNHLLSGKSIGKGLLATRHYFGKQE